MTLRRVTANEVEVREVMNIYSLLDACEYVLGLNGDPHSSDSLALQIMEMRLWRASEADVRDALTKDIQKHGEASLFVGIAEDEFALRSWKAE